MSDICTVCGLPLEIGDYPCVLTTRPHGKMLRYQPFVPYFDVGLGEQVGSLADRWRHMREKNLVDRDLPRKGDLSARLDRQHEIQKASR